MTRKEFHLLRRGDYVTSEVEGSPYKPDYWRVRGKAHLDAKTGQHLITLTHSIVPSWHEVLCLTTIANYKLSPYTRKRYDTAS